MTHLAEKVDKVRASGKREVIKTWSRRSMVTPEFVGLTIAVHDGKKIYFGICYRKYGGALSR